ncbi:MAG: hypothetical protein ACE5QF_08055 [Thermoplasmata archaeon]
MMRKDARAVENPISAIFDLAEQVTEQQPKLRKLVRFATIFVGAGLLVDFLFILILMPISFPFLLILFTSLLLLRWFSTATARAILISVATINAFLILLFLWWAAGFAGLRFGAGAVLGTILLGLFILGVVILNLVHEIGGFFDYYWLRYRVIKSVRDEDPVVYIPQGEDSVRKVLNYLAQRNPDLTNDFSLPGAVTIPAILRGRGGFFYKFDAYVSRSSGPLWRILKIGCPGYAIYIKHFAKRPKLQDLMALKHAVEEITAASGLPPRRVIALWTREGEESLDDDAYDFLTSEAGVVKSGVSIMNCSLELISENPDGTYDFIPYVSDVPDGHS